MRVLDSARIDNDVLDVLHHQYFRRWQRIRPANETELAYSCRSEIRQRHRLSAKTPTAVTSLSDADFVRIGMFEQTD